MTEVCGKRTGEVVSWFHKDPARSNQHCLYCAAPVGAAPDTVPSDKEHLIGRNLVPTGTLASGFNFHFRACRECNARKGDAERHVSSVTLFNSPARLQDARVDAIAARKGEKDFHPARKGVRVQDASHKIELHGSMGSLSFSADMVAPPQLDDDAVRLLAFNQIQGFFTLCTTEDYLNPETYLLLEPKHWHFFGSYGHGDWGNPQLRDVADRVREWPVRARIHTASGYFRGCLRRSPDEKGPWHWGLEWNKSLRVFGAIANPSDPLFKNLPELSWARLSEKVRMRVEVQEPEDFDGLFAETRPVA
jgi:hypothetical protein